MDIKWSDEHGCYELHVGGPGNPTARSTSLELLEGFLEYLKTRNPGDSLSSLETTGQGDSA